ncbi:hypothetical protein [Hymenobacter sp. B81]|uniref:hypothetical protein n=1 Tax=Hymenobacter sp. B81 TaxID=3344878 RepID=UPI0037DD1E6B
MASNLDYLDPALLPLEETVRTYLETEEELRKAQVTQQTRQAEPAAQPAASLHQNPAELQQHISHLESKLTELRTEILRQLPARDEWVKVNLGYGPSRVGAFRNEAADGEEQYLIRVVH